MKLEINIKDWVKCQFIGLTMEDRNLLFDKFKVFVPSARYTSIYKLGRWNGYINYFQLTGVTYTNLIPEILQAIDSSKYTINITYSETMIKDVELPTSIDKNYWGDKVWYQGHRMEGQPIVLEEHQVRMINNYLNNHRSIFSIATSAGKTILSAVLLNEITKHGKGLIIVPSKDLCTQSADEYRKLGLDTGIVGCGLREFGHKITVCTWQTIHSIENRKNEDTLSYDELNKMKEGLTGIIFDECFDGKTLITMSNGQTKQIKDCKEGDKIISYNEQLNKFEEDEIIKLHTNLNQSRTENMYQLEMEDGTIIEVTGNHKVLTVNGWKEVKELTIGDDIISYNK